MDSRLVAYLTWFKDHERGMNPANDLASSAVAGPEDTLLDLLKSRELPERLKSRDPWWHPELIKQLKQGYHVTEGRELIITNGASGAIWLVCQALISPGDHVIVESPVYQPLLSAPIFLKGEISLLERKPEENYAIDIDRLAALLRPGTRLIVLTDLHNPSGYPLGAGVLSWLREVVHRRGGRLKVLVDETYRDLAPGEREVVANLDESFISISTLSKAYGLATLRCGWIVASGETYEKIRDTYVMVEGSGSQLGESLASLVVEQLDGYQARSRATCAENRKIVSEFMEPLIAEGRIFGRIPDHGPLYFPRIAGMADTEDFTRELRESWDVYVVPGRFFGAPGHIRVGFGGEPGHLAGKLERLAEAIRARTVEGG